MFARDRFLQAFAFLTIFPVTSESHGPAAVALFAYARYFPIVGMVIGLLSGSIYYWASAIWSGILPAVVAIATGLIATGALHEDGLADTADGFGGGWTREQRLMIMKDSRLGTFGVLALIFSLAVRICAVAMLTPSVGLLALFAVHAGARFTPVLILATQDYAGDRAMAKTAYSETRLAPQEVRYALISAVLAMLSIFFMRPWPTLFGIVLGGTMALALAIYSKKAIGGYSGDVLGAIEQVSEIGFLLGLAA
jgi:adenosylcobinamide-GDP ribazoletransferase